MKQKLLTQGIRIVRGHDANRLRSLKVKDTMCENYEFLRTSTPFHELVKMVLHSPFPHFMVFDEKDFLAGVISLRDIRSRLADPGYNGDDEVAADIMTKDVITVRENQNLEDAFHQFSQGNFSFLPVLSQNNSKKVAGYLKKDDLLNTYEQHILRGQVRPANRWVSPKSNPLI